MANGRGEFSSRIGFIAAAAGSAVGLGNIWGFPTQAASNGGAAFVLVYLLLAFMLAFPVLMAELVIGRHAHANAVRALQQIAPTRPAALIGRLTGLAGVLVAALILSFYAIVAGWMIAFGTAAVAELTGLDAFAAWLTSFAFVPSFLCMLAFMLLTIGIVSAGVRRGIERWSERLMPMLLVTLVVLTGYVLTLDGAMSGLRIYLLPDIERAVSANLVLDALGSAFFSLSLGVGTMLIYGSYISDRENLPVVGGLVTMVDVLIAVLAGFLVLPAMYAALHNGVEIFAADGRLLSEDTLIFTVLPRLFETMGLAGELVSCAFFLLMTIAALTSSISMLEVPVAYAIEEHDTGRRTASLIVGSAVAAASTIILWQFDTLFGLVVTVTTRYGQPLLGLMMCIYAGWIWRRDGILRELSKADPDARHRLFYKLWPWYLRFICPVIIVAVFANLAFG